MKIKLLTGAAALLAATLLHAADYKLTAAEGADVDALRVLTQSLSTAPEAATEIIVGQAGSAAIKPYESKIPTAAESYFLAIEPGKVVIAGRDGSGTFYGVQDFLQLADKKAAQQRSESPAMAKRGVIEGFYGNPWSHRDRLSQFDFYGRHKLNTYVYGPKDDPYHHRRWYEPYPPEKAAEMAELVRHADANKVKFVWAMHPSNAIEPGVDREKALAKFQLMYDLGVRNFAIFFDDISAKSVDTQIDYLNFLDDKFVKTHPGVGNLIVCPTVYNRSWASGDYLYKMGTQLHPSIEIMWTGNSVCDMINVGDCEWFTEQTTRKPFIWLNYPVNDYGQHNLLMGPVSGNDREIDTMVTAFCSNPMQYAEASKVALYQLADFAWNPANYNEQQSWLAATAELEPEHLEAFRAFCLNNVDVGLSVHSLRCLGETPDFEAILNESGSKTKEETMAQMAAWFASQREYANELLLASNKSPLLSEVHEWIEAMQLQGRRGLAMTQMYTALENHNPEAFIKAYESYKTDTEMADEIVSRGFEGSIQSVRVKTGTLYVEPTIKELVARLIEEYKTHGYPVPEGLFPQQVLENGTYYIKHDGRWLGNPEAGSKGGNPVFQDTIDDINPNRQEWHIKLDSQTERYSIVNSKDERYVNELGNFGVNPYSKDWNTYEITVKDGKYAIRNAGNGGQAFWGVDGNRFNHAKHTDNHYIFEIIPVNQ